LRSTMRTADFFGERGLCRTLFQFHSHPRRSLPRARGKIRLGFRARARGIRPRRCLAARLVHFGEGLVEPRTIAGNLCRNIDLARGSELDVFFIDEVFHCTLLLHKQEDTRCAGGGERGLSEVPPVAARVTVVFRHRSLTCVT